MYECLKTLTLTTFAAVVALGSHGEARPRPRSPGQGEAGSSASTASCSLSPADRFERDSELVTLFRDSTATEELEDGYGFQFPWTEDAPGKLLRLIEKERACCRFFTFELIFPPDRGPIWLRLRGSKEVKTFVEAAAEGLRSRLAADRAAGRRE